MAGRPTDYKEEYNEQAYKLCLLGYIDRELAEFFEVEESTINNWKIAHPEFLESMNKGKSLADARVAERLFNRATGYMFTETTYEKVVVDKPESPELEERDGEDIELELYKKKVVAKELAPDTVAAKFWLINRQRKKWRDKIETGITDNEGNDVESVVYMIPDNGRKKNDTKAAEGLSGEGAEQLG